MLAVLRVTRELRFMRPGRLLPWLGPALRGLVARPFKDAVCVHPPAERDTRWVHCRGCPHLAGCPYGQTLEPDPPPGAEVFHGQEDAARPVVLALPFPMPVRVAPGDTFPLTLTLVGSTAIGHEAEVWRAVADAGSRLGFDPAGTTFTLGEGETREGPVPIELPLAADGEVVERVRVELTGPLFLRTRSADGRRRVVTRPGFADLLRASLRTLGGLFRVYDAPLPADFEGLKAAAEAVPLLRSNYMPFQQDHRSNRSGERTLQGVVGNGLYGPVPRGLLTWLEWGGKVHVGTDRVASAGGWRGRVEGSKALSCPLSS